MCVVTLLLTAMSTITTFIDVCMYITQWKEIKFIPCKLTITGSSIYINDEATVTTAGV